MDVIESNALFSVSTNRIKKVILDKLIATEESHTFYRPAKIRLEKIRFNKPIAHSDGIKNLRIQSLEKELLHYRGLFDEMMLQKTEKLNRRLAILESCNSKLGENYHKIHQMYLDLLVKTQSPEAELYQHTLEEELSMLTQTPLV